MKARDVAGIELLHGGLHHLATVSGQGDVDATTVGDASLRQVFGPA